MGPYLIYGAFAGALISSILYFLSSGGSAKYVKQARMFFHLSAILTISSTAFLLYLIMTHQFQYTYVWNYSSRDLPWNLLIATFYAGQEGSFHLWAFLMAILGVFLLPYLANRDSEKLPGNLPNDKYEPLVMGVFTLISAFLLFIMIIKSPYLFVWQSFPADVQIGFIPEDGRGLNPLLQNFWMSIHPPILFMGFTSLSVPFSFAIAALVKNRYDKWMKLALPWTLFGGMILGLGIMLGGYWAYGVLGWGGYWAWDPVENSSFVPWLLIIAAIHTMVAEEKVGKYKRTSLVLCILAYSTVLYSTFLTRSGVLGDASVHSFVDPGQEVYLFLVVLLTIFAGGGLGLIAFRFKSLKTEKAEGQANLLSRESALFVGAITICATALVIAVGTSWPIIAKGTVEPDFYNRMNLPLAILIAAINGISILLRWKHSDEKSFFKSLYMPLGFTFAITILLVILGVRDLLMALLAAASFFAAFINAEIAYTIFRKNKAKAGAYIAHMGVMLLFLGVIGSARYSVEENVSLPMGEPKQVLDGYVLTYKGATEIPGDREKYHFNVIVQKDDNAFLLQPVMYYSEYSEGIMKNPDIANLVTRDLYLSPMALEEPGQFTPNDMHSFKKGEEKDINGMKVKFVDFDRTKFNRDEMESGKLNVMGAEFEVTIDGKTEKIIAEQEISNNGANPLPVKPAGNDKYTFYFTKMSVETEATVELAVIDEEKMEHSHGAPETLILTASVKPFINLVWGGTIIMVIGFYLSLLTRHRRIKAETRKSDHLSSGENSNGDHSNGNGNVKAHHIKKHKHAEEEEEV
ncbi:MAG TPA: cytochrome c-type biogenesis CcmF C-terminal domain-containing protein [Ignavibacteria bacterium]|nr:cytochrome C biogenesis protein [Bacteroidota bacterium]HRE10603.1 cytochrome c-type biogenesis CcmF C-terminal domain-containing protein [Ignavibacteria bacterium]HRF67446.1 cytochrome c-type biogenesis CcmF C-terminal domain-containing protein [Ignavibacteria bacterium]HRJ05296.1 cytochrome c-type biogenesis CcmF C-terminal domain-containing protein [Ignavibacteria bacterium]HRJ85572.1 cytochrome c-type biogenesis CcmF C-terminal domain-containing protein [Ignavibacteria bacterium]